MVAKRTLLAGIAVLGVACGGAVFGQAGGGGAGAGASGGEEGERELLPFEPVLERERINNRDWTVKVRLQLFGLDDRFRDTRRLNAFGSTSGIDAKGAVVVLPMPSLSGYAEVKGTEPRGNVWLTEIGRGEVSREPRVLEGYQSGQRLAAFDVDELRGVTNLRFEVEYDIVSYETEIDEARAQRIDWVDELPEDPAVRTSLLPQLFVESDDEKIMEYVERVTRGDPRKVRPYVLAKYLAKEVLENYTVNGQRVDASFRSGARRFVGGLSEGFLVRGAAAALRNGGGSPYDLSNLLCAVYRAAGLPARVVIGLDQRAETEPSRERVIAWVEFFLAHPGTGTGEWIPVDIVRQREFSTRTPPLERRWEFFGRNESAEFYCPVAFHWHPPTAVVNQGPPALWGWTIETPSGALPDAVQQITLFAQGTPLRGDDREAVRERNERRSSGGG